MNITIKMRTSVVINCGKRVLSLAVSEWQKMTILQRMTGVSMINMDTTASEDLPNSRHCNSWLGAFCFEQWQDAFSIIYFNGKLLIATKKISDNVDSSQEIRNIT